MQGRMRELRKALGISQEGLGDRIGLKSNSISQMENGGRPIVERTVIAICKEFNVNRQWLVDGTGPMFVEPDDEFATLVTDIATGDDVEVKAFVKVIATLSKEERALLLKIARRVVKEFID